MGDFGASALADLRASGASGWVIFGLGLVGAILLVITGLVSSARRWMDYTLRDKPMPATQISYRTPEQMSMFVELRRPGWWWAAHASAGIVALADQQA